MKRPMFIYLATLAMLGATWFELRASLATPPVPLAASLETIPDQWQGSPSVTLKVAVEDLVQLEPTAYLSRGYNTSPPMQLFIAYFDTQRAGKSMHSPKNCLPLAGFETVESRRITIPTDIGPQEVNLYRVRGEGQSLLMLYWYQSPGRVVASEFTAKGYLLLDRLVNHRSPGSIVRVSVADGPGALDAASKMAGWAIPEMRRAIGS